MSLLLVSRKKFKGNANSRNLKIYAFTTFCKMSDYNLNIRSKKGLQKVTYIVLHFMQPQFLNSHETLC